FSSRRRHTRSKRDWSSDVCSSDLQSRRNSVIWNLIYSISKIFLLHKINLSPLLILACNQVYKNIRCILFAVKDRRNRNFGLALGHRPHLLTHPGCSHVWVLWDGHTLPGPPAVSAPELREPPDTPAGAWHLSAASEHSHGSPRPGTPRAFCFSV